MTPSFSPQEIQPEHIGQRLRTEDCPLDYWVRVTAIQPGGIWTKDVYDKELWFDNPRLRFFLVDENCSCDKLKKAVETGGGVLIACAVHSFTGVKGMI